jgi:hypothetical protein
MKTLYRGIAVGLLQCLMVLSLAGKYAIDRERRPRQWARAFPADPTLPIRGRYVSLRLEGWPANQPVAFFIPEHVPDPSRRANGEELWVEVSVPHKGPARPIRLAVKKDGVLTPLGLR